MPKPLPVAVLEAKKEDEELLKGMQQAKGYADCKRFDVKYVFATNGHRYGEFDFFTNLQAGPFQFEKFPAHVDLTNRYAKDTGIDITTPEAKMLFMADSPAWSQSRYYQDAAIRAAFEKIIRSNKKDNPARVLLSLATGSGKTIIATNLLWRLHEAEMLPKPVLFLCDRDELREQAYNKLKAAFGDNVRIVKTQNGHNAAKNARIHIATYQTLGLDDDTEDDKVASFLTENYAEDAFSVIIIDECHRSAWGRWSEVLKRNPNAIHIGLTATPRQLYGSEKSTAEDNEITSNNLKYFGESVYEYTLVQAQEDGYLADRRAKARKDMQPFLIEVKQIKEDIIVLKEQLRQFKKEKADPDEIEKLNQKIKEQEKAVRDAQSRANDIDAAVFDLKAVNPNVVVKIDTRTPLDIIKNIEAQGEIVTNAMQKLKDLID